MQISRAQNQPTFKARTLFPDATAMAKHLNTPAISKLEWQSKIVEKQGDDLTTLHAILYNPSKRAPFGIFTEMKDICGKRVIKLRENLRLSQLGAAAQKNFKKAQEELRALPLRKEINSIVAFKNRLRIQEMANALVIKAPKS